MSLESPTWLERRPMWQKVLAVIAVIVLILGSVFWLGTQQGRDWADSEYLQERDKRDKVIAAHEANERELAAENEVLRTQNEATAQILKQLDAANDVKKAETFARLQDERKKKEDEIQNATPGDSINGLCDDAKRAGFTLSFCG